MPVSESLAVFYPGRFDETVNTLESLLVSLQPYAATLGEPLDLMSCDVGPTGDTFSKEVFLRGLNEGKPLLSSVVYATRELHCMMTSWVDVLSTTE
jgi:hypothetical protein